MPPKSKKADATESNGDKAKAGAAPPSSRRSARIAGSAAPPSTDQKQTENESSKKRSGEMATASVSKKAKTASASKTEAASAPEPESESEPKSGTKASSKSKRSKSRSKASKPETVDEAEEEETGEKEEEEEKKEEAPASAKPTKSSSGKVLGEGDTLPSITLVDEMGDEVDVSSLTGAGEGVVLFLYPKADTPGCTNQACGFRDHFDEISKLGYKIYGLSKDKPAAQKKWKEKKTLNYSLLCDPESKLIKRLGAFVAPNNTKRSHFIFEKGTGKLVDIAIGVKPADDPKKCLEFIKKL